MDPADGSSGSNQDYFWDKFDPEAYISAYYRDPHPDDEALVRLTCSALKRASGSNPSLDIVDVGTGPNLFPLLAALPSASRLTAWEYSANNIAWLHSELSRPRLRPELRHFWRIVRQEYVDKVRLPVDPAEALHQRTVVQEGSIFGLPERAWDAATMFFCAESITERHDEFERGCACFARCTRIGGTLVAAFLAGSRGYNVGTHRFPALTLSENDVRAVFTKMAADVVTTNIGIVEKEIRSGYSGMVFLTARSM